MTQQGFKSAITPGMGTPRPVHRLSRVWALAAVAIVLLLVVGIPVGYVIIQWTRSVSNVPRAVSEFASNVLRPTVIVQNIDVGTIEGMRNQNKLVVLETTVSADITRNESAKSWGVYWGTNTARVIARDARVQYTIDLSTIGTSSFVADDARKVVTLTVPRPKLDADMVSIDPAKIETADLSGGWMRWNKRDTWDHAVAELKPKVIIEGSRPWIREKAEANGRQNLIALLSPLVDTLSKNGVTLEIRYRD